MRYILYFLVYSCLIISLFVTFLFLMTVVDPGLLQFKEKVAWMMKPNVEGVRVEELVRKIGCSSVLPEMYIDFSELWNRSSNIVHIN